MPSCSNGCGRSYSLNGPVQKRLKMCKVCVRNINGWGNRDIGEACEYQWILDVRRARMSHVVSRREVRTHVVTRVREMRKDAQREARHGT
jgi:hypothetical protein